MRRDASSGGGGSSWPASSSRSKPFSVRRRAAAMRRRPCWPRRRDPREAADAADARVSHHDGGHGRRRTTRHGCTATAASPTPTRRQPTLLAPGAGCRTMPAPRPRTMTSRAGPTRRPPEPAALRRALAVRASGATAEDARGRRRDATPGLSLSLAPMAPVAPVATDPSADGGASDGGAAPDFEVDLGQPAGVRSSTSRTAGSRRKARVPPTRASVLGRARRRQGGARGRRHARHPTDCRSSPADQRVVELGERADTDRRRDRLARRVRRRHVAGADADGPARRASSREHRQLGLFRSRSSSSSASSRGWSSSASCACSGSSIAGCERSKRRSPVSSSATSRWSAPRPCAAPRTCSSGVTGRFVQVVIVYTWAIFSLSLFDRTRGYAEHITALITAPLWATVTRIGGALPILVFVVIVVFRPRARRPLRVPLLRQHLARGDQGRLARAADLARAHRRARPHRDHRRGFPRRRSAPHRRQRGRARPARDAAAAATISLACVPLPRDRRRRHGRHLRPAPSGAAIASSGRGGAARSSPCRSSTSVSPTTPAAPCASPTSPRSSDPVRIGGVRRRRLLVTVALPADGAARGVRQRHRQLALLACSGAVRQRRAGRVEHQPRSDHPAVGSGARRPARSCSSARR